MCLLKSDGKSCTAYKVFKYNFYIGSVKKNIDFYEKEKGHLLHQNGLFILSLVCKPEIQFKQLTYKTRSFCCVWI